MIKTHLAIHIAPGASRVRILEIGTDYEKCKNAYRACNDEGEVMLYKAMPAEATKRNKAAPKADPKPIKAKPAKAETAIG